VRKKYQHSLNQFQDACGSYGRPLSCEHKQYKEFQ
jgi:hypothetical protein